MRTCPSCNRPILYGSKFCPICGKRVRAEELKPRDVDSIQEDIKDWQRYKIVFTYFFVICLCLGIILMFLDLVGWATILGFILAVFFMVMSICSHVKVTDLKRRLGGW